MNNIYSGPDRRANPDGEVDPHDCDCSSFCFVFLLVGLAAVLSVMINWDVELTPGDLRVIEATCKDNGGLKKASKDWGDEMNIVCLNGAEFVLGRVALTKAIQETK